jgi:CspA family cold shock protein
MPTGKARFFDAAKGYGFITEDTTAESVFFHATSLPRGIDNITPGTRVEYSVVDGKKGKQAMTIRIVEPMKSVVEAKRRPANDMIPVVEDLIKVLDEVSNSFRAGHYPDARTSRLVARLLREVARDLDK